VSFERLHPALQHHIVNSLGWQDLRPLQAATIDPILDGKTIVAVAPTAAGKTEAAMFPLLSRMATEDWHGLSVLYVCPLKALLNNLEPRLSNLAGFVGRRVGLWHGDVGSGARSRLLDDPPEILLTTPESIEAILISRRTDHETFFRNVRAVVVDEIHAFGGDDRGWHLLAVLERVSALTAQSIQRIGLSATVGDPESLLQWLRGSSDAAAEVVNPTGQTAAAPEVMVDYVHSLDNAAHVISSLHRGEKRLVFADSRARVEDLAVALRKRDVATFVSHSSLSLDQRRQAEQAFSEARDCVIVATSTLELGIDVGDLDRVIQLGASGTVASFLQRLGRTGRRPDTTRNTLFLALRPELSLATTLGLLLRWSEGYVEPISAPPEPLHLFVQQLLALVLQQGQLGRNLWARELGALPVIKSFIDDGRAGAIVEHLVDIGALVDDHGLLSIGPGAEKVFGYRHFMELTSLFTTNPLFNVRWGAKDLGLIDPVSLTRPDGARGTILLGGHAWDVGHIDWRHNEVAVTPSEHDDGKSRWQGESVPLSASVCDGVRRVLAGEDPSGVTLSQRAATTLGQLRDEFHWVKPGTTTLASTARGTRWFTFAGLRANKAIAAQLGHRLDSGQIDNLSIPIDRALTLDDLKRVRSNLELSVVTPADEFSVKFGETLTDDLLEFMATSRRSDPAAIARLQVEPIAGFRG
jgi:ATP-dependent helicase Lhr and Lhr-like helicase